MGTIIARPRKDGSTGYSAQIVIKRGGAIVHRERRTFDRRAAAAAWLKKRETELAAPGGIERAKAPTVTLGHVIGRYVAEATTSMGRTKRQVLAAIMAHDIAEADCAALTSADIVAFAQSLDVQPQTRANYLSHLAAVFAVARPAWGYPLDQQAMRDAIVVAKRLGLTSKSRPRSRRPTLAELDAILDHFTAAQRRRPAANPMSDIVLFALFSTRRLEEITRLRWADLDRAGARILVRDMKNPGQTIGNDVWCDLPAPALAVIDGRTAEGDVIFPAGADAIGAAFTRACRLLGIADLHFHDLRHEGVSRLFEMGLSIPHVAAVSGHRSWTSLKRYTHLRQTGDKYAGWARLPAGPYPATARPVGGA